MEKYFGRDCSLDEIRGYPRVHGDKILLATYHPQDIADRKDYEKTLNKAALDSSGDEEETSESNVAETDAATKAHGKTKRRNWKFWFQQDVAKCIKLSREGMVTNVSTINSAPTLDGVCKALNTHEGKLFFDIETNPETNQLVCFSFGNHTHVTAVPIMGYSGDLFYGLSGTAKILQALCGCLLRNGVCIHNSLFDLFILLWKYKLPAPPQELIEDTMLMQHRLYPEAEKSLGHIVAQYTNQPYHKNTAGTWVPHNRTQLDALLLYNAKDVETMSLC